LRLSREGTLTAVYVEARPKGYPEGSPIVDYVIEDREDRILTTLPTLLDAIEWAKQQGYAPLITRIRQMNDKARPDHWREV
jgi:hypothetical protein